MLASARDVAPPFAAAWSQHERRVVRLAVEAVCCYFDVALCDVLTSRKARHAEARRWLAYLLTDDLSFSDEAVAAFFARPKQSLHSMLRTRQKADSAERRYIGRMLRRLFAWQCRLSPVERTEDFDWYRDPLYGMAQTAAWRRNMDAFLCAPMRRAPAYERRTDQYLVQHMPCG